MATYWATTKGVPALGLEPADIQLIARGAVKGALHHENIDDILTCLGEPQIVLADLEEAVGNLEHYDFLHVTMALQNVGHSMMSIFGAMCKCDSQVSKS